MTHSVVWIHILGIRFAFLRTCVYSVNGHGDIHVLSLIQLKQTKSLRLGFFLA